MADFFKLKSFECDVKKVIHERGLDKNGKVQKFIDTKCLELCRQKVPKDSNTLIESGDNLTKKGSGELEYRTPYARRWYYMPANFNGAPERGNYWFERMKNQYRTKILKAAQKIANGG